MRRSSNEKNSEKYMSFWEHLEELRWVIVKILIACIITTVISFIFVDRTLQLILTPLKPLIDSGKIMINQSSPFDAFFIQLKIGFMGGVILCVPYILYQVWTFISPAFKIREEKAFLNFVVFGSVLFLTGVFLSYKALSIMISAMLTFSIEGAANIWKLREYVDFVFQWMLVVGLIFELPLIIVIVTRAGLLKLEMLKKGRPFAYILAFVLGAILTPPDVLSQIMVAIPLIFLYEAGILLSGFNKKEDIQDPQAEPVKKADKNYEDQENKIFDNTGIP